MNETRVCNMCFREKPLNEFYKYKKKYYQHTCKACSNLIARRKRENSKLNKTKGV